MKSVRLATLCIALLAGATMEGWSQSAPAQAFDNVIIHTADGNTIEDGTIIWRNGIIQRVGENLSIPFDAFVIDGKDSLHAYPGFIDGMALWGSPDLPKRYEQPDRPGDPGYARAGIQPQRSPGSLLDASDKALADALKHGFTTAALGMKGQMLPGQIDLFFLNGEETDEYRFAKSIAMLGQFESAPGGFGSGAYPSTLMGVMTRYRQLWNDAGALRDQMAYYASAGDNYPAPKNDEVLEALFPVMSKEIPFYFVADTRENIERLLWLQDDLGFEVVLVSGKEAYTKADELKEHGIPVLASIDLPDKPEWKAAEEREMEKEEEQQKEAEEPETAEEVEQISEEMRIFRDRQLQAYRADIENIARLMEAGVRVGYASNGMKLDDISKHVATLIDEGGLTAQQVLEMMTKNTADILGIGSRTGDLKEGRIASFTVFTRPFTEKKTEVIYAISDGNLHEFEVTAPKSEKEEN